MMTRKVLGGRTTVQSLAALLCCMTACAPPGAPAPPEPPAGDVPVASPAPAAPLPSPPSAAVPDAPVVTGVEVLLRDSLHLIRGRRVGLITNHTGIVVGGAGDLESTIDVLHGHPELALTALYGPEHGLRGTAEAGEKVESGRDAMTGLPIHSLYGAGRKPSPEVLAEIDVMLFDIQDIGSRYYTYVWTMALAMEAAGEAGLPFVVLDRPNPIGGHLVQGNILEPAYSTFVGLYPVAMRHGLTAGELARMLVGEFGIRVDLTVIPMEGWARDEWFDETGLPWIAPSPNMPSLASATHYPGTCLFEGTNLSVGRGTDAAFQHIGAPWLDARALADRLNARALPGVRFEAVSFTPEAPGDGKFGGELVHGVRFVATDRDTYDPTVAAIAALVEVHAIHGDQLTWHISHFDRLAGTDRVRLAVEEGASLQEIVATWAAQARSFEQASRPYLLYR